MPRFLPLASFALAFNSNDALDRKVTVVLLADCGFGRSELARTCQMIGFRYVVCIRPDVWIEVVVQKRGRDARATRPTVNVPRLLYMMKRTFAHWLKRKLHERDQSLLKRLTVREAPGRYVFRVWQAGPGRVHTLASPAALTAAIDHIHEGPVRRGLCDSPDEWRWSSWRRYHRPAHPPDPDLPRIQTPPLRAARGAASD